MYSSNKSKEFPITITYCTKIRTLYQEKANSNETFSEILERFEKNYLYKKDAKLKSSYYINDREIRKKQLLEELVKENTSQPLNNVVDKAELSIELEDLCYNGDASYQNYKKIILPKSNPFSLYIYSPKEKNIILQNIPEKNISLFELNNFNEGSAYCNGYNELYISGGNDNNKDFWMINNSNFEIKKQNMLSGKKNHSMIYINFNDENEWVFIAGGEDKKTYYYDIKKNYFINWGNSLEVHIKPALIKVGEYLYIFDEINIKKIFFERTKIIEPTRKWEKIVPNFDKKLMDNFPSNFGVSFDSSGKILLLGGNNVKTVNDTYIYEPGINTIVLSKNGTNDNMLFYDKTFYKVNKRYSINIPENLNEVKEIGVSDKQDQSLIKLSLNIVSNDEYNVASKLSFDDKIQYCSEDKGNITIKASYKEIKQNKYNQNYNYNYNQSKEQPIICDDCLQNNTLICQFCRKSFQKNCNYPNGQMGPDFNPTMENPRVTIIHDQYYPTLSKNKYRARDKGKVDIIYDEYTPIKVDYELKKPGVTIKKYLYVKKSKEEIRKNEEEKPIKKEENIVHNEEPEQSSQNVHNEQEENIEQNLQEEEKAQIEQNEQKAQIEQNEQNFENPNLEQNIENDQKDDNEQKGQNKDNEENIENEDNIQNVENGLKEDNENIVQNAQDDKNIDNDEVEYKNYENNEQENRDDDIFIENEQNHQNDVIIEENQNHYESNYNEDIEVQPDQEQNNNIPEEEVEGEGQGKIRNKSEENNDQIEHKEEYISMEEENNQHIENSEEHKDQNEIQHIENIEDDDREENNTENNNIVSQNKDKEIINGELPKDSLEFNDNAKIHEDENDLKPQHELDFNNQEINNQNEIQKPGLGEEQAHEENKENKNEINIEENKNGENDNIILDGEEFHSMEEEGGEQNNSVQHIENGNNEEMYENGKEIKFEGGEENEDGNENNVYNGEENMENIKDEDENKILEYEGEGLEGEQEGEMDVEEIEVHEEKIEGGDMNGEEGMEEGEELHNEEGMKEGEGEEMHYEEGMEEGEDIHNEEGMEEGEDIYNEEGMEEGEENHNEEGMEEGEEMHYEEGIEEGEEMHYEEGIEEGEEMNFEEGEGEEGEGNVSVFENNEDNEEHEHNGNNEGNGDNNKES